MEDTTSKKIKPMSKTEIANAYGVSLTTLNKWMLPFNDKIGAYRGKCYTPKQVGVIFEVLGSVC